MDLGFYRHLAVRLRHRLMEHGVTANLIILFGSRARGTHREDSDIDIAVVSEDFGKDRFEEGVLLNTVATQIDHRMECIPIGTRDYLDQQSISPILHEIDKTGVDLL